jgi:hypothetical protein
MAQQPSDPAVASERPEPQDWDEIVRALAAELGELAETHPAEAEPARRLAFSLLELVGLFGIVSDDFVADMVSRAERLLASERIRPGFAVPKAYEDDGDDEVTKPEGLARRRRIGSGARRIDPRAEPMQLRLRAG